MAHRASRRRRFRTPTLLARALLMFALILSLGWTTGLSPLAVGAASIVVTTTADTVDASKGCDTIVIGDLPGGGDVKVSLREAICAANNTAGDDVITFEAGLGSPITLGGTELTITSNITITGPGKAALTIDGNGESRIFSNVGGIVAISDLTVTNGFEAEGDGGAIANSGQLTLTDVAVTDSAINSLFFYGGGIYNGGESALNLVRTTVSGNSGFFGGGIANDCLGTSTISDSTIDGNHATFGGGIANACQGILTVSDSAIVGNDAFIAGGGLYNEGQAELIDTSVSGNTAMDGGGIASGTGSATRTASTSAVVFSTALALTRVTVSGNAASAGGGIALQDSPVQTSAVTPGVTTINESTITDNEACLGGGIANDFAELAITNSTISGNRAMGSPGDSVEPIDCTGEVPNGGGIWATGLLTLSNSTVSGNSADHQGGGLYLEGAVGGDEPVTIAYSTITGNTAGGGDGGGIYYAFLQLGATPALVAQGVTLNSSIVAGNNGPPGWEDCDGTITSNGHNLVGEGTGCPTNGTGDLITDDITDVLNTTLADNGGQTETHALVANSPALDGGDQVACTEVINNLDQRGVARPPLSCDIGAFELTLLTLTVQTEGSGLVTVSPTPASSAGTAANMTYQYPPNTVVTLTATPGAGQVFARWTIDGVGPLPYGKGWASPLTITLDTAHTAKATFAARPDFSDVPSSHPSYIAITELTARGIIKGYTQPGCDHLGTALPCFGPDDQTERAQTAALLVRLLGLGSGTTGNGGFTDLAGLDPDLHNAVLVVAAAEIMQGYGGGMFGPYDKTSYLQTILVISRGFVVQGYWTRATIDDPTIYPNLALSADERLDFVTFVKNAGPLPGFANTTDRAPLDLPAPRSWTAEALWLALDGYFSTDGTGKGGFVP